MSLQLPWAPPTASTMAIRVDILFHVLLSITGIVAIVIMILMVVFAVKYRRGSPANRDSPPTNFPALEISWTLTPLFIFIGIFVWAAWLYADFYRAPMNAMPIFVIGKQWMWKLEHANGRREIDELHLPLGQPVRLVLGTEDVIHSFFVPAFRIKQDAVPGRYTSITFTPSELGEFHLYCAEYCGTDHSRMRGKIIVMPPAEFQRWLASGNNETNMATRGFALFRHFGCSGCHDPRSTVHAPSLVGVFGHPVHLQDGRTVWVDENYIRDSILQPRKDVVAGFDPAMPTFQGQINEEQLLDLIAYVKSLGDASP